MSLPVAVLTALALGDAATEADAVAAITQLRGDLATATNAAAQPPLEKFVPRADYDAAMARASNAETRLKDIEAAQQNQAIETALNAALQAGQICPATVEFYRAGCQKEGGLEAFQTFIKTAPPILGAKPELDGQKPPTALNRAAFEALSPVARAAYLKTGARITD